ncbi:uncharacterized protein LOC129914231 [Episyrphus balteatus]|uniref:uncharacterized protein LOC129914231 n=1 Tax=Episyrphus balteatus TaxID=286459 RepID=UPI002485B2FB|nr:uncharacterized protein LOC129914231 [Episyrphus balteatus]XP_055849354.1 uncharacterized protein LOC129914231 [Episyrphus balteatus]XP_055849355.1 uncharacterized protein LOC129914231 [Episyrphus balteatus]
MKLPICQYSKLFLLLTAFSFLDFLRADLTTVNSVQDISPSLASLLLSSSSSVSSLVPSTIENKSQQLETATTPNSRHEYEQKQEQQQQQNIRTSSSLLPNRVGILMSSRVLNTMKMQQGFENFVEFFKVNLDNATVEFIKDDGLSAFIKQLEGKNYTTIVKTLNSDGINEEYEENDNMQKQKSRSDENDANEKNRLRNAVGYCHLMEGLSKDFNKTVLLWPCPRIKESNNFLPSFEAISFAVKSVAAKLNWTQVDIFVGDNNWGLPLTIAANLHIPYRIKIGESAGEDLTANDVAGKAIIITADMNDASTLRILSRLEALNHTKVLLIDIIATSFNAGNKFYKNLSLMKSTSRLMSNLLLLTVLSDKYRHFLNVAFDDNRIGTVQSFHQMRRWQQQAPTVKTESNILPQNVDWPMRLDRSVELEQVDLPFECKNTSFPVQKTKEVCSDIESFVQQCGVENKTQSTEQIKELCNSTTVQYPGIAARIAILRNFIDFFHFYDFIIANAARRSTVGSNLQLPKYDFLVLDIVRSTGNKTASPYEFKWRPMLILEQHEINLTTFITHSILPGYNDWLSERTSQLWQCGTLCWTVVGVCLAFLLCIIMASVAAGITLRNYFLRKRLSKGPNKIVLSASDFVFPVDSRRVDEGIEAMLCCWLQQLQEFGGPEVDKPDLLKGSIGSLKNFGLALAGGAGGTGAGGGGGSLGGGGGANTTSVSGGAKNTSGSGSLARHNPGLLDMRARYNGDLVQLKEITMNGSSELKSKAMDLMVMEHGLRHENVNPLIGWLSDPNRNAMVFDYCSRGSLQDVLIMDEIKLDWSFRLSLLTDLVRGMRYLHSTPLRFHGNLTSRNCVVDARWVLKITDYGISSFYEAQGITPSNKTPKELLWTAPELLRNLKGHNRGGTQMGDVYSFGIIMQEVVVRGEPYCMLSLSPEEIIAKIKKPPPLIRPSVSKGAAPPEAINIMRQCWAETPDMRPDFNSVYERFKMLNHGRKVNFVDTMFQMLEKYSNNLEELIRERTDQLDIERKKTEQLLNRMLPSSVAEKLKMGLGVDPEEFSDVTIYFSDIVGFTTIAAHCSPVQVVDLLNDLYTIFDATINAYNVYKVETIGDAYMVVSGLPVRIPDHAEQIATMALDLLHQSGRFSVKHLPGVPLQLRIGLHTGPCCAGVVGLTMPRYCLFGDTVNTASRMESTGSSWRIHMSQETRDRLEATNNYQIEPRGLIEIKGKGLMNTFWLLGKKGFDKTLPVPPPIGLDEFFIRNSISFKGMATKSRNSTNPSSSQSSLLAGEAVEVKVEITPPSNADSSAYMANSYSLDSNSTNTIGANMSLMTEFPIKTPSPSTCSRKINDIQPDQLLNPQNFNRLPGSSGGSSSRLYKKIEEMIDLSSPYNHYKCLSPSESNLTQFYDGKYMYSCTKFDSKPGSSRLLRRQFSLDRDDGTQTAVSLPLSTTTTATTVIGKQATMLEIPTLQENRCSPKCTLPRVHKLSSTSIAQDLEKIEEIPLSPASSQHHSSLDSNMNRSPPLFEENTRMPRTPNRVIENNVRKQQEVTLTVETFMTR